MSICDSCIHDDVCGLEDNHEEGIVSCADRIPKDVLDKIRAEIEQIIGERNLDDYDFCSGLICARKILDKYRKRGTKE